MQGSGSFTILIGVLAGMLWLKFFYDSSPTSVWLPVSFSITFVVSLVVWIIRRRDA